MINEPAVTVWAEIDLKTLKKNLRIIRSLISNTTKIMGVVKFDAYGHGAVNIGRVLVENGIDALGVASAEEGVQLRNSGIEAPILIMNKSLSEEVEEIVYYNLTPMVCSMDFAEELACCTQKTQKTLGVHVRVDTSDSNIGVKPKDFKGFVEKLKKKKNIYLNGIFTHIISAYTGDIRALEEEISLFKKTIAFFEQNSNYDLLIHAYSSPGIFKYSESQFPMIRTGTSLYGLPSFKHQDMKGLEPVMQLKSRIIDIHSNDSLKHMEYTGITELKGSVRTALVPVGYGYVPALIHMKDGNVLVNGVRVPVLGSAFMDHIIVDVSKLPNVKKGDEVVVFGRQSDQVISVQEVAEKCGISVERCESICLLNSKVKRVYVDSVHDCHEG